jgi:hypothetical protein
MHSSSIILQYARHDATLRIRISADNSMTLDTHHTRARTNARTHTRMHARTHACTHARTHILHVVTPGGVGCLAPGLHKLPGAQCRCSHGSCMPHPQACSGPGSYCPCESHELACSRSQSQEPYNSLYIMQNASTCSMSQSKEPLRAGLGLNPSIFHSDSVTVKSHCNYSLYAMHNIAGSASTSR